MRSSSHSDGPLWGEHRLSRSPSSHIFCARNPQFTNDYHFQGLDEEHTIVTISHPVCGWNSRAEHFLSCLACYQTVDLVYVTIVREINKDTLVYLNREQTTTGQC